MSIVAIAKIKAGEGKALEALTLIQTSQKKALASGLCEKFDILQSSTDPGFFSLLEVWSSRENHTKFLGGLMSDSEFTAAMVCIESGPNIEYFNLMKEGFYATQLID